MKKSEYKININMKQILPLCLVSNSKSTTEENRIFKRTKWENTL